MRWFFREFSLDQEESYERNELKKWIIDFIITSWWNGDSPCFDKYPSKNQQEWLVGLINLILNLLN